MNRKLLTSTLHILHRNQYFFFLWKSFWLTVGTNFNKTNKLKFSGKLSAHQRKCFQLSSFIRQPIAFLGKFFSIGLILSDKLSPYQGNLFHSSYFLRHCHHVTGNGTTWNVFTDKLCHRLDWKFIHTLLVFKMKEKDWQLFRYFFLWWVFEFLAALSLYGNFHICVKLLCNICHNFFGNCLIYIATVNLIQSSCFSQTIVWNFCYWNAFAQSKRQIYIWKLWYPNYEN